MDLTKEEIIDFENERQQRINHSNNYIKTKIEAINWYIDWMKENYVRQTENGIPVFNFKGCECIIIMPLMEDRFALKQIDGSKDLGNGVGVQYWMKK